MAGFAEVMVPPSPRVTITSVASRTIATCNSVGVADVSPAGVALTAPPWWTGRRLPTHS
jgi:hypothetical protein